MVGLRCNSTDSTSLEIVLDSDGCPKDVEDRGSNGLKEELGIFALVAEV